MGTALMFSLCTIKAGPNRNHLLTATAVAVAVGPCGLTLSARTQSISYRVPLPLSKRRRRLNDKVYESIDATGPTALPKLLDEDVIGIALKGTESPNIHVRGHGCGAARIFNVVLRTLLQFLLSSVRFCAFGEGAMHRLYLWSMGSRWEIMEPSPWRGVCSRPSWKVNRPAVSGLRGL